MADLNVPLSRVVTHQSWSGKACPSKLLGRWDSFLAGIGGGGDANLCYGTVAASGGLNIRSQPDSGSVITGALPDGSYVQLLSRVSGTVVSGNSYWFGVTGGYVSAYYINVQSGSQQAWCSKN